MPFKSVVLTPALKRYIARYGLRLSPAQRALLERTERETAVPYFQISPEQGTFLTMIVRLMGVSRAIEIGTFTGYSSLCIAMGLRPDGHLLCCDVSEDWTALGKDAWRDAGVADRIELRLAPAAETLADLPAEPTFDFAFVDGDKSGYWDYHNMLLPRLRRGGVIVYDNVLYRGEVVNEHATGNAAVMRAFNRNIAGDHRVDLTMVPFADGMTIVRKID